MTLKEAIEYWELFNSEIDELLYLYRSDAARKKALEKQREVAEYTIAALRGQREEFIPPCYQPDDDEPKTPCDLCLYNPPSSGDGKPCTMCPASSLPESPKEEHHAE